MACEIAGFGDHTNKALSGHCSGRRSKNINDKVFVMYLQIYNNRGNEYDS